MNQIFLPSLLSLNIRNFSLYPNNGGLDFHYDFKNGLNLFVGGNGTGKTTLTKLIKFALIGHYREQTDTSIYKGVERIKRPEYPKIIIATEWMTVSQIIIWQKLLSLLI